MAGAVRVTLRELIKDPIYREWLKKPPALTVVGNSPPWRVFTKEEVEGNNWETEDFDDYSLAYRFVAKNIKELYDAVINSKRQAYRPPVVRKVINGIPKRRLHLPTPETDAYVLKEQHKHVWCPYCRRPTLFLWYKKHHAMNGAVLSPHDRRCHVCGVRLTFIKRYG